MDHYNQLQQQSQYEQQYALQQNHHLVPQMTYDLNHLADYERPSSLMMPNTHHKNETKPRLGKDEVARLEAAFQKNPKPTTNTKKKFADDMDVDLSRINNWFQNRRAKRKQEKKQAAYEKQQAQEAASGLPSYFENDSHSPEDFNGFHENHHVSYAIMPSASAPFNPNYANPSEASLQSLNRSLAAASAVDYSNDFANTHQTAFTASLVLHGGPESDRSHFPPPGGNGTGLTAQFSMKNSIYDDSEFNYNDGLPHSNMAEFGVTEADRAFGSYTSTAVESSMEPTAVFPSQLLPSGTESSTSPEGEESADEVFVPERSRNSESQSPPSSASFRSPPPPTDLAARRTKVHHRPAALGMDTIRSRPSLGPRTASQATEIRRPLGSPAMSSPMRRIASTGGSAVITGRVQKSGIRSAQRSPVDPRFFADRIERSIHAPKLNYQNLRIPQADDSSIASSLAPPTPMSDERDLSNFAGAGASQSPENYQLSSSYSYNPQPSFFNHDEHPFSNEMTSPPETPSAPWFYQPSCTISDEAMYTPVHDEFATAAFGLGDMPAYLRAAQPASQPVTPFGQEFNPSIMYPGTNDSPQYQLTSNNEYTFPTDFSCPIGILPNANSPPRKQKQASFQFSNSTPADFAEK